MSTIQTSRPVGRPCFFDRPLTNAEKQARHRARVKAQLKELEQLRQNGKTTKGKRIFHESTSCEWYTPPELIEKVRTVLRTIDLDPASCAQANESVKARRFFDKKKNGLKQNWFGRVFLNPPYGTLCRHFIGKLLEEYEAHRVTQALVLLNLNTMDRKYMKPILDMAAICIISGRVKFLSPNARKINQPTNGSIVLYLGSNPSRFRRVFSEIGTILQ
jgi:ParB family transcriptional regulator, chromosome partitioning protein